MEAFNITSLGVIANLVSLRMSVANGTEKSLNTTEYAPSIRELIDGLMEGPVKDMGNGFITNLIHEYQQKNCTEVCFRTQI